MYKKVKRPFLFLVLFFLFALFLIIWEQRRREGDPSIIKISGNIETTEVDISFQVAGKIEKRFVDEGDKVEKGQKIAALDDTPLRQERAIRLAETSNAQAALEEMEKGYLPEEIAQAEAKAKQAEAEWRRSALDYERQKRLFEGKTIAPREWEASEAGYRVAQAKYGEATENLRLLKRGTRPEKIEQAKAKLNQAKEALELADTRLGYAVLTSPLAGFVLSKNAEAGEYASVGSSVVTIGDLHRVWLRAYIAESDLGKIFLGQEAEIKTDSYPDKVYRGKIGFISSQAEFTPKNIQTEKERVKLVYRIKIYIDNREEELKPGMPADGYLHLKS